MKTVHRRLLILWIIVALVSLPVFAAKIPREAGNLSFTGPEGAEISLDQFKGKVVALEFLLTTCPHCKRTSGVMGKLYKELGPKGFQALGVAINDGAKTLVQPYQRELSLTYPIGYIHRDKAVDFLQHPVMLTMWMPQLLLIDKNGQIRGQFGGADKFFQNEEANMRQKIMELLSE